MYEELINSEVLVIVATKSDQFLEYKGLIVSENDECIKLKNVSISFPTVKFQRNVFGEGIASYKSNLDTVIVNKKFIISCNKE